ncbi:histidine phosphatase family protein [Vagococcus hydrophili]|uniref:Histidine phosphatase family protein n=1 Tax=Vagococcus hydrophili TaxID=2714947 RepID=A0A6G8AR99_9ENTE|nr:histidine phosphatase family protein [Vagococcus hydrophili]QIL47608.1 histidine phosphatase family protein [Vagococcus hydrophili]
MKLYFTRHGKTQWNKEMRFQGREGDSPLLPESYLEIEELGKHLKDVSFEAIYSSPMTRAQKTAEGICQELTNCPEIIYSDALKELGLGELEGTKIVDSREKFGEEMWALRNEPSQYSHEKFKGEPFEEMIKRSTELVKKAISENEVGPLLFVSHGVTLGACIQTLIGTPLADLRKQGGLSNNSLSIIDYSDGQFTLELWNDDSFLNK